MSCSAAVFFWVVVVLLTHSYIAFSSNAISACVAAAVATASAASGVAPAASGASLARLAKVCTNSAFFA
jgi:hypothetical protein